MMEYTDIGTLKYLYLDEIEITNGTDADSFLIEVAAKLLQQTGGRNWLPVIVKELSEDRYEVIGNSFVYAVAERATATARIDEAPRQFWKSLDSIVALKCGITKGKGLDLLKTVFYLTPESQQDAVIEEFSEETLKLKTVSELKTLAKEKGIVGLSKMKKAELVRILAQ